MCKKAIEILDAQIPIIFVAYDVFIHLTIVVHKQLLGTYLYKALRQTNV